MVLVLRGLKGSKTLATMAPRSTAQSTYPSPNRRGQRTSRSQREAISVRNASGDWWLDSVGISDCQSMAVWLPLECSRLGRALREKHLPLGPPAPRQSWPIQASMNRIYLGSLRQDGVHDQSRIDLTPTWSGERRGQIQLTCRDGTDRLQCREPSNGA